MKRYQTVKETMERTGLGRSTLMQRFDRPEITFRIGRTIRFDADALDEAIQNQQIKQKG